MAKTIGKTAIWTILYFWVSPPDYTNWEFMFLMQQLHVQWRVYWNLLCCTHNLVLFEKYLKKKDFVSLTQVIKLLVWVPKIIKTYAELMQWVNVVLQFGLKWTTVKSALKILLIFQTISDKNYGKNCYLDNFVFLSHSPS